MNKRPLISAESKSVYLIPFGIGIAYTIILTMIAAMSKDPDLAIFREEGFFEQYSIAAWLAAGIAAIVYSWRSWSAALFFVMCAAREDDWQKKFTTDGIFKIRYYTDSHAPILEKILSGLVVSLFIGLVIYLLIKGFGYLRAKKFEFDLCSAFILIGASLFFVAKILDRSASLLSSHFNFITPENVMRYRLAYEEGFEMLTPVFFALGFFIIKFSSKRKMKI